MNQIINSILDNDLYKFSMQNAVLQKFPDLKVKYSFKDRNNIVYPVGFEHRIRHKLAEMSLLHLKPDEEKFLQSIKYFPRSYVDFLRGYRFNPNEVDVFLDVERHLHVKINGYWFSTILWEVPILAIISELYYEETNQTPSWYYERDLNKMKEMENHNAYFSDFGTRRRQSYQNQRRVVQIFANLGNHCFVGTSNVHLAQTYNIKAIGTMAHEWIMAHGAIYGYRMANKLALNNWADVYGGNLGIALSDTYTTDAFLKSFDMKLAKLFDGVRQDSGDPFEFANKVIAHYKSMGIDPMSKTIIFSDALDIKKACEIKEYCVGKIKSSFGIGTHLTNDVGVKPLNIVIKLLAVEVNGEWIDAIKLSDDKGKHMGNEEEISLCKKTLKIL
jgi:nicotinate phosphoribosyltransferase